MYDEKDGRRASAGRQSRDVLLRVLYERDAGCRGTSADSSSSCGQSAPAWAFRMTSLVTSRSPPNSTRSASLRSRDTILRKPGPLSGEEWHFVRRHPLIGERILSSAPALAKVSGLVRSTHARMDGAGYPDGLAGEEIPIGARIIGTCAAFVAMTSELPYRSARSPEQAVEELRRCAGTQFDADVVETLYIVGAQRARGRPCRRRLTNGLRSADDPS